MVAPAAAQSVLLSGCLCPGSGGGGGGAPEVTSRAPGRLTFLAQRALQPALESAHARHAGERISLALVGGALLSVGSSGEEGEEGHDEGNSEEECTGKCLFIPRGFDRRRMRTLAMEAAAAAGSSEGRIAAGGRGCWRGEGQGGRRNYTFLVPL